MSRLTGAKTAAERAWEAFKLSVQRQEGEASFADQLEKVSQRDAEVPVEPLTLPDDVGDAAPVRPPDEPEVSAATGAPLTPEDAGTPSPAQPSDPFQADPLTPAEGERLMDAAGAPPIPRDGPRGPVSNMNYERIRTEDDIQAFLEEQFRLAEERGEGLDVTAPRTTNEQTAQEASRVTWREITEAAENNVPLSRAQLNYARQVEVRLIEDLQKQAEDLKIRKAQGQMSPEDEFKFRQDAAKVGAIGRFLAGEKRRAAQLLQSLSAPVEGSPLRGIARDEVLQNLQRQKATSLDDVLDGILGATKAEEVTAVIDGPTKLARIGKVMGNVWFNAVLSKFAIPKAAIGGAFVSKGLMPVETFLAAVNGSVARAIRSNDKALPSTQNALNQQVRFGEAAVELFGLFTGFRDAIPEIVKALKDPEHSLGRTMFDRPDNRPDTLHQALGDRGRAFLPLNMAAQIADALTQNGSRRGLAMTDIVVKSVVGQQKMKALAYRIAVNEGLSGDALAKRVGEVLAEMPDEVFEQTFLKTREATLTQTLGIPYFEDAVHLVNKTPLLKFFVPFLRTMLAAVELGIERLPLAQFISPRVREAFAAGGASRQEVIAKMYVGTALIGWGMMDGEEGRTTVGWFLNKSEQGSLMKSGWRPGAAVKDGSFYNINFISPMSDLYMFGAALGETAKYWTRDYDETDPRYKTPTDRAVALAGASVLIFVDSTLNKSVGAGLRELIELIDDQARYGAYKLGRTLPPFATPAGSAILNRTLFDATRRRVPDRGTGATNTLMEVVDAWKRDIPGMSDDLPPAVDFFGNDMTYASYWDSIWNKSESVKGIEAEIMTAMQLNFIPANSPRKYYTTFTGARINLDTDVPPNMWKESYLEKNPEAAKRGYAYYRYSQIMGETMKEVLGDLVRRREFMRLPIAEANNPDGIEGQGDELERAMMRARVVARARFEQEVRANTKRRMFESMEALRRETTRKEGFVSPALEDEAQRRREAAGRSRF